MDISFDNVSLNSGNYRVTRLKHEHSSQRESYSYELARERGSILIEGNFKSKDVVVEGRISGSSKAELETNIDTLKEVLSRASKNLDIEYSTGYRRYRNCMAVDIVVDRQYFHLSYAPFEVKFVIPSGVGEDTSNTVVTQTGVTVATNTNAVTIGGSTFPSPTVKITFASATSVTQASLTIGGDKVTYDGTLVASDVLIFDLDNKKVTLNGIEKDYTGLFPKFVVGSNSYQIITNGTAMNYSVEVSYKKKWL